MIRVVAGSYIKPECVEDYLAIVKELVEKTNQLDAGCKKYEMCRDINDPLHFVMLEEWESQEALDNHMKAPHFLELIPKMSTFGDKPGTITILQKI